jgi:hypothetical protein
MKKLILTLALCCTFSAVSNAIWLPAFFLRFVAAWGEQRECDVARAACERSRNPRICEDAARICAETRGL